MKGSKTQWLFFETEKRAYLENNSDILRINHSFLFNHRNHSPAYYLNNYNLQLSLNSMVLSDSGTLLNQIIKVMTRLFKGEFIRNGYRVNLFYLSSIPSRFLPRQELKSRETEVEEMEKDLGRRSTALEPSRLQLPYQYVIFNCSWTMMRSPLNLCVSGFTIKWTDSIIYAAYILNKKDSVPVFCSPL